MTVAAMPENAFQLRDELLATTSPSKTLSAGEVVALEPWLLALGTLPSSHFEGPAAQQAALLSVYGAVGWLDICLHGAHLAQPFSTALEDACIKALELCAVVIQAHAGSADARMQEARCLAVKLVEGIMGTHTNSGDLPGLGQLLKEMTEQHGSANALPADLRPQTPLGVSAIAEAEPVLDRLLSAIVSPEGAEAVATLLHREPGGSAAISLSAARGLALHARGCNMLDTLMQAAVSTCMGADGDSQSAMLELELLHQLCAHGLPEASPSQQVQAHLSRLLAALSASACYGAAMQPLLGIIDGVLGHEASACMELKKAAAGQTLGALSGLMAAVAIEGPDAGSSLCWGHVNSSLVLVEPPQLAAAGLNPGGLLATVQNILSNAWPLPELALLAKDTPWFILSPGSPSQQVSEAVLRLAMLAQYYELSPAAPRDSESWAQLARKLLALLAQWVRVGALLLPDLELDASHAQALLALLQDGCSSDLLEPASALAAALMAPGSLPSRLSAAIVGAVLRSSHPWADTLLSGQPLRVAVAILLGAVKAGRDDENSRMPSCLTMGDSAASSSLYDQGSCAWVSELLVDFIMGAAAAATCQGQTLPGSQPSSRWASTRLAPVLLAWAYLPLRTRAVLLVATCQLLERVAATPGFGPDTGDGMLSMAAGRAELLELLHYQLAHWEQPPSAWALSATEASLGCSATATHVEVEHRPASLPVEWATMLANSSSAERLPGANILREVATSLKSGGSALFFPTGGRLGASAEAAAAAVNAAQGNEVWEAATVVILDAGDSEVGRPRSTAETNVCEDELIAVETPLCRLQVFLHGWELLQECTTPPPLGALEPGALNINSSSFMHQTVSATGPLTTSQLLMLLNEAQSAYGKAVQTLLPPVAAAASQAVLTAAVRADTECFEELRDALRSACGDEGVEELQRLERLQAYRHAVAALAHAGTTGAADSPPPQQSQVLVQAAAQALQASLAEEPANGSPLLSDADHLLPIVDALGTGRQAGDTALLKLLAAVAETRRKAGLEASKVIMAALARSQAGDVGFLRCYVLPQGGSEDVTNLGISLMEQMLLLPQDGAEGHTEAVANLPGAVTHLLAMLAEAAAQELSSSEVLSRCVLERLQGAVRALLHASVQVPASGLAALLAFMPSLAEAARRCALAQRGQLLAAFAPLLQLLTHVLGGGAAASKLPIGKTGLAIEGPSSLSSASHTAETVEGGGQLSSAHSEHQSDTHDDDGDGDALYPEDEDDIEREDAEELDEEIIEEDIDDDEDADLDDMDEDEEDEEDEDLDDEDVLDDIELAIESTLGYRLSPSGRRNRRWAVLQVPGGGQSLLSAPSSSTRRGGAAGRGAGASGGSRNTCVCSYTRSGESFVEQHWYFCYTCGLTESKGCCSSCAIICHDGHDVVYSGKSRFFCDCGADVEDATALQLDVAMAAMTPLDKAGLDEGDITAMQAALPEVGEATVGSAIPPLLAMGGWLMEHLEVEATAAAGVASAFTLPPLQAVQAPLKLLPPVDTLPSMLRGGGGSSSARGSSTPTAKPDLLVLARSVKASSLDAKGRGSSAGTHTSSFGVGGEPLFRLLAFWPSLELAGSSLRMPTRWLTTLMHYASRCWRSRASMDPSVWVISPMPMAVLARHAIKFDIISLMFDASGHHLAVIGLRDIQVWTLDTTGRVSDRLPVMLPLSPHGYDDGGMPDVMVQVAWMPGSSTRLVVAALHCLWLYDLAFSAKQPAIRVEDGVMCSVALPSESDSISQIVGYRGDGFTTKRRTPGARPCTYFLAQLGELIACFGSRGSSSSSRGAAPLLRMRLTADGRQLASASLINNSK
eukprot:jgi/Tetstr1/437662/TSEL_026329.t1